MLRRLRNIHKLIVYSTSLLLHVIFLLLHVIFLAVTRYFLAVTRYFSCCYTLFFLLLHVIFLAVYSTQCPFGFLSRCESLFWWAWGCFILDWTLFSRIPRRKFFRYSAAIYTVCSTILKFFSDCTYPNCNNRHFFCSKETKNTETKRAFKILCQPK